jgi:hypothetical protein
MSGQRETSEIDGLIHLKHCEVMELFQLTKCLKSLKYTRFVKRTEVERLKVRNKAKIDAVKLMHAKAEAENAVKDAWANSQ